MQKISHKNKKAGLYIHIPFCQSKCPYCDFYSVKYDKSAAEKYVDKLISQIKLYSDEFDSVYFGGGTPSILESDLIGKILDACYKQFDIDDNSEITIECNPSKDLSNDFKAYKNFGINRVSIGMQSAVKSERLALGRIADKTMVAKAVNDARAAGINNISLDLMLGTPKQTTDSLEKTFAFVKDMNITHISAYMLKIENNTPFYKLRDKLDLPNDDDVCDMYLKTAKVLFELGFNQYEISNFAKPGFESRHNIKYWELTPYLGLGASAHSFYNGERFYYDRNFNKFSDGAGGGRDEEIMLGLRMNKGIKKSLVDKDISPYLKAGLMIQNGDNIALTLQGMLLSNTIIGNLIC